MSDAECFVCGGSWQRTHIELLRAEVERLRSQLSARDADVRALREAVQTAYGFLWCVNSELGAPHQYSAERAAYEARKVLRNLLTHEQIGAGINAAVAVVRSGDES